VTAAFRDSYFSPRRLGEHHVALATARAGNVIGGGDWSEDRLIPDLIRGFNARQPVLIRRPQAIRPWQHVLEPLHGYITLAERLLEGSADSATAFNFGPGEDDAWPVERIATKLASMWGSGASWIHDTAPGVHEAHYLKLDSSKARVELGWRPHLNLETALEWTLDWYRQWNSGGDMAAETRAQIKRYEALVAAAQSA
jgi:CDP-glucose 4,6-dehydratase